jgi:hypothetical protein
VTSLRRHLLKHRASAALLLLVALMMRVLVPAGFMPVLDRGTITITLCSGAGPQKIEVAMPGMVAAEMATHGAGHHSDSEPHEKSQAPCVFSGLAAPALSAADPILLAVAIVFVMAFGLRTPDRPVVTPALRLRPPLRGPPARS